jgi:MFS family permease
MGLLAIPALRQRSFLTFWAGIIVALSGYFMGLVVRGWVVKEITDSPFWLGATYAAAGLPELFLAPVAGVVVDRFDRKRVLMVTQTLNALNALLLAALLQAGLVTTPVLVLFALWHGAVAAFDWTVRLAIVPNLVPKEAVESAVMLASGAWILAGILGPAATGLLLPRLGAVGCLVFTGLSFLPFLLSLIKLPPVPPPAAHPDQPWYHSTVDGYRYVLRHPLLRILLLLEAVPVVIGIPFSSMLPLFAERLAPGAGMLGEQALGWLHAGSGAGALVGVLAMSVVGGSRSRGLWMSGSAVLFGLLVVVFGGSSSLHLSFVLLLAAGCAQSLYATLNATLVQSTTDDAYRGRVMSVYNILWGLTPLGGLSLGALASRFEPQAAVQVHGGLVVVIVLLVTLLSPRLRSVK